MLKRKKICTCTKSGCFGEFLQKTCLGPLGVNIAPSTLHKKWKKKPSERAFKIAKWIHFVVFESVTSN